MIKSKSVALHERLLVIKTWWVNRLTSYLIPLPLLLVTVREFFRADVANAITTFFWGILIIVLFEIFFFRFKIVIRGDELTYWVRPEVLCHPVQFKRSEVKNIELAHFGPGARFKSANIVVNTKNPNRPKIVLRLSSFSPSDVRWVIAWLNFHSVEEETK